MASKADVFITCWGKLGLHEWEKMLWKVILENHCFSRFHHKYTTAAISNRTTVALSLKDFLPGLGMFGRYSNKAALLPLWSFPLFERFGESLTLSRLSVLSLCHHLHYMIFTLVALVRLLVLISP